ncbi:DUF4336 domain-containing protein [Blastomonas sp.]|uniref:DUF4336 domain-containing protein n=1 Tax=Blastomonas sp. TaxID=1909299 RepID=UPI0035948C2B
MSQSMFGYRLYEPQLRLIPWGEGIWTVNGPEVSYSLSGVTIPCPTRMTVVKLQDGSLWLHSPVSCDPELVTAVSALGPVSAIVAPNTLHYTFLADWVRAFPATSTYAAPNLNTKFPHIAFSVLGEQFSEKWRGDIDLHVVALGSFTEVVFFHRPSRTLIVTDLMQNFEASRVQGALVRTLLIVGGATGPNGRPSIEIRLAALLHRAALRRGVEQMLAWEPTGIILSHGECYQTDGVVEIKRAFG